MIEEPQVVVHEADEPDALGHFPDANVLTGDDLTAIDFATADAQSAALRDGDGAVVEGIIELRQACIGPRRGSVELGRYRMFSAWCGRSWLVYSGDIAELPTPASSARAGFTLS